MAGAVVLLVGLAALCSDAGAFSVGGGIGIPPFCPPFGIGGVAPALEAQESVGLPYGILEAEPNCVPTDFAGPDFIGPGFGSAGSEIPVQESSSSLESPGFGSQYCENPGPISPSYGDVKYGSPGTVSPGYAGSSYVRPGPISPGYNTPSFGSLVPAIPGYGNVNYVGPSFGIPNNSGGPVSVTPGNRGQQKRGYVPRAKEYGHINYRSSERCNPGYDIVSTAPQGFVTPNYEANNHRITGYNQYYGKQSYLNNRCERPNSENPSAGYDLQFYGNQNHDSECSGYVDPCYRAQSYSAPAFGRPCYAGARTAGYGSRARQSYGRGPARVYGNLRRASPGLRGQAYRNPNAGFQACFGFPQCMVPPVVPQALWNAGCVMPMEASCPPAATEPPGGAAAPAAAPPPPPLQLPLGADTTK